ncbi:aquaporin-9 isoform X2 [Trichosurus vulpecula]|uniref:aquaporin-9 isoform X2 n=1 Tax=Trichosurus vulpecula TaxID=9337 RepID=UPI00186AC65E|nr:aquaporin-9 isoform X2 [Trichosurus vulpecula]
MIRGCKIQDMDRKVEKTFKEKIILKSSLAKETVAEFLGTFMMVVLGCGSVAQAVLSRGTAGGTITANVGFALAVGMAVYVTGGISDALQSFADGKLLVTGENATAQIFATYPIKYLTLPNEFADQVLSSTFLLVVVFAIFDDKNWRVPRGLEPIVIGLLILVLSSSLGLNSGCAMNPARDLGPRIFTALAGWGLEVFTAGSHFWWIPVVGPFLGGALGGFIYIYGIEIHHAQPESDEKTEQVEEKHELSVIM